MDKKIIGERVRLHRGRMTQTELAAKAGLTKQTICKIENGKQIYVRADTLDLIANILNVYPEYLTGEIDFCSYDDWIDTGGFSYGLKEAAAISSFLESLGYRDFEPFADNGCGLIEFTNPKGQAVAIEIGMFLQIVSHFKHMLDGACIPRRLLPEIMENRTLRIHKNDLDIMY